MVKTHIGNVKFSLDGDLEVGLRQVDQREPHPAFIHLFHPSGARQTDTLSRVAWNSPSVKELLVQLTNRGYSTYMSRPGESRLVHRTRLKDIWQPLGSGAYSEDSDGQIYEYYPPLSGLRAEKLLVIFCPVFDPVLSSSLDRYFNRTFLTIQKFLPNNTAVLRVADVGGVLGAFYMNTQFRPNNEELLMTFLGDFTYSLNLRPDDVVLYGASKGGTASLAYGLRGNYKFVAVDPIIDDAFYHGSHNDLHFTRTDIFLESKNVMFDHIYRDFIARLDTDVIRSGTRVQRAVICSEGSPLFPYLERSTIRALNDHVSFFNSHNPKIDSHPGVAQNTINILTMLLNAFLYDQCFQPGVISVF